MNKPIYLDNAATTPLPTEVKQHVISLLDQFYNPSSIYQGGQQSRKIIDDARSSIMKFINCDPNESDILFTSGGSASNTLGIAGYYRKNDCTILYSPTLHKSALKCIAAYDDCGGDVYYIKVDKFGVIDIEYLNEWLDNHLSNPFVVLEYANSEIGTVQDVKKIINMVHSYNGIVYLDCTASISTIPLDVKKLDVDIAGFSGHKLGALKGVGVLYKKKSIQLEPLIYGTQEQETVGGTENILGIASFGKACEIFDYATALPQLRDYIWNYVKSEIPECYLVGADILSGKRLSHNLFMAIPGIEGESLMLLMDMNGIQISTSSACSANSLQPSPTLLGIGMNKKDLNSCIRITLSGTETKEDLEYVCQTLVKCVKQLKQLI